MPLTKNPPNTVVLTGRQTMVVIPSIPVIDTGCKPGMHAELFDSSGTLAWRKHSSATKMPSPYIFLEKIGQYGIDDAYDSGSEGLVGVLEGGQEYYPLIASGENITLGDYLRSNGAGLLVEAADADAADNVSRSQAIETIGVVAASTRCRVIWNG